VLTLETIFSDLSKVSSPLKVTILEGFNHPNEEVKSAASYALGNISLGNLKEYLPFVLKEIESQPKKQYLLLHSLKEVNKGENTQRRITNERTFLYCTHADHLGAIFELR